MNAKIYTRNKLRLPKNLAKFHNQKILKLIVVLTIAISFAYFSIRAIEPIMEKQCKNMAKSIATKISNNECTKVMEGYSYNDMLNITKDKDGNVLMVETNIITINKIISAIPVSIQEQMEKQGRFAARKEGYSEGRWIAVDYGDVIVHIFHKDTREVYGLDNLWNNGGNVTDYNAD